jgi:hypothetical protein
MLAMTDHEREFTDDVGLTDDGSAVVRPETIEAKATAYDRWPSRQSTSRTWHRPASSRPSE